jgi:hypothetical protein
MPCMPNVWLYAGISNNTIGFPPVFLHQNVQLSRACDSAGTLHGDSPTSFHYVCVQIQYAGKRDTKVVEHDENFADFFRIEVFAHKNGPFSARFFCIHYGGEHAIFTVV